MLKVNTLLSPDINECAGINPCQQLCENTEGSYTCSCTEGFNLTAQTGICTGTAMTGIFISLKAASVYCSINFHMHSSKIAM